MPAGKLRANRDKLKVLRMGAVSVQSIEIEPDHKPRVSVNLHHSWRYSLFCSQGTGGDVAAVAVESSNGLDGRLDEAMQVQNTFIDVVSMEDLVVQRSRPRSAPEVVATHETEPPVTRASSSGEDPGTQHSSGGCQPCLFQSRHFSDPAKHPACTKPECYARYCHLPHSEDYLAKYKAQKRRYEKKNRTAYRRTLEQEEDLQV